MSIVAPQGESRVLLRRVSWPTFEASLADTDSRGTRFTYDRGWLEIVSPSREHDRVKRFFGRMIEVMTEEMDIPISSGGSTTLMDALEQRGIEPDECYYVAHEPQMRGRDDYDPTVNPPPDLAIKVDISRSSLDKLSIYADLRVPEVWVYHGSSLHSHHLREDGAYAEEGFSLAFPFLPLSEIERFLGQRNATDETTWIRSFRAWVRGLKR